MLCSVVPSVSILEAEPVEFEGTESLDEAEKRNTELNEHRTQVVIAALIEHGIFRCRGACIRRTSGSRGRAWY